MQCHRATCTPAICISRYNWELQNLNSISEHQTGPDQSLPCTQPIRLFRMPNARRAPCTSKSQVDLQRDSSQFVWMELWKAGAPVHSTEDQCDQMLTTVVALWTTVRGLPRPPRPPSMSSRLHDRAGAGKQDPVRVQSARAAGQGGSQRDYKEAARRP